MLVYRGETRFLGVNLAALLAEGDSLTGSPDVQIVAKRGRGETELLTTSPAAPALSESEVQFWVDVPLDQERGIYLAIVQCGTTNGEIVVEEAPIVVQ